MKIVLFDFDTHGHHLKYAGELADFLLKKGDDVLFITKKKDERVDQFIKDHPGVSVKFIYEKESDLQKNNSFIERRFADINNFHQAFKIAENWGADILHLLYTDTMYPLYLITLKNWKFKFFCSCFWLFSSAIALPQDSFQLKLIKKMNGVLLKKMIKKGAVKSFFNHNIYPEKFKEAVAEKWAWIEKYPGNFLFLQEPIYEDFYQISSPDEARNKLDLPKDIPIFLFFGALTFSKGLDILLESLKYIDKKICLVIAGAPFYFSEKEINKFKEAIKDKHILAARIYFIPEENAPYYFMAADVVVMPYRREYTMGTSGILMQACSARKPVICSDVGIFGQLIRDNSFGLLAEPESSKSLAEEILKFLGNREEIAKKAESSGQNYFKLAYWPNVAELIYQAYKTD